MKKTILVVDDEMVIAETMSYILSQHGYKVITAFNAQSALELTNEEKPDLLLSDVMMPGITGVELATKLKACHPNLAVILISGHNNSFKDLPEGHGFTLLAKPVGPTAMLQAIGRLLA